MLKYWWTLLLVALVACGGGNTAPTSVPSTAPAVAAEQAVAPVPQVAAAPQLEWEGSIGDFASWSVKNLTTAKQSYTAYYTDFDNQSKSLDSRTGVVAPNDVFSGTFNKTCVQVDVTQGAAGTAPFLFGYINADGKVVKSITPDDRAKCGVVPCVEKWVEQEPVITYEGEGCTRVKITTITSINSCTKEKKSSVKREGAAEPVYSYAGEFSIDYLSNSGNGYQLLDDNVLWQTLNLKSGSNLKPTYPHATDGSSLCLRWPTTGPTTYVYTFHDSDKDIRDACAADNGTWLSSNKTCTTTVDHGSSWTIDPPGHSWYRSASRVVVPGTTTYENIGCAKASCPSETVLKQEADVVSLWHGTVSFKCKQINLCETN